MRRLVLAVATLELFVLPVSAQTADEIITKYVNKIGGAEQIHAIKTLRRTGKLTLGGGFEAVLVHENKRPDMVRQDMTLQGMTGVVAYDGHSGWKIEPWQGKKDAEPLGEEELKEMLEESDFDGPLIDYQQKGNKIELIGLEPVEGTDALKLKVTLKSGGVRYFYMDTDYYVPIKIETKRFVRGAEREYESTLGDYKQVGGVYLPHSIETSAKGSQQKAKIQFEKIEANVPIDDSRFHEPGAKRRPGMPTAEGAVQKQPRTVEGTRSAVQSHSHPASVKVDSETISGLGARNIGSAAMSGRVAALDAIQEGKRLTVYIGAASGGVWKSVNSGTTYKPVFDKQPVQSIGALAIDRKNPKTVWVGTGESWTRNSTSVGDGVYKSTDGGDNWTHMGLRESERISKIAIDPSDSNTVYVCVPGKLWSDSDERGLYKTADGGKTWAKILGGPNRSTGCSTMALDPRDSKTIYAGLWDFRRQGWTFRSGGDGPKAQSGSGLKKTTDGGATWTDLNEKTARGLPPKPWGRLAIAVAPVEARCRLCLHRSRGAQEWPVPLRRRRTNLGRARPQPEYDLAPLLLRQSDRGPEGREHDLQARRKLDHEHGRRQELQQHFGRRAWRLPRSLDQPEQHGPPHRGRRRRGLVLLRRRQPLVEGRKPTDLAVLSRLRRHGHALSCVWRSSRQQLLGRRLSVSGWDHESSMGEYVRRRWLLDVQ